MEYKKNIKLLERHNLSFMEHKGVLLKHKTCLFPDTEMDGVMLRQRREGRRKGWKAKDEDF